MLKISRLADYATVIMSFLASKSRGHFSATQIAAETRISAPTVSKILKLLNESSLVNSVRGVNGGYQLLNHPEAISLAEIITAIDGRPAMTECSKEEDCCTRGDVCELRGNWQVINRVVFNALDSLSLADMNRPLAEPLRFRELKETKKVRTE
ncbi:SUF system Fe-S cluster assembly regulator [Candidiatus Paracoxiella cheracis]|uniref:SUF system Fe-S cluster assembly regulator n=1 Tax=Candidiatus Paracoxiella cheracis TaxID=3405120 RepID=UPI003BF47DE2